MTLLPADPDELVALGAFAGAQVLIVILSVIKANAHQERALMLHAVATMLAVFAVQMLVGSHPLFPQVVLLLVMGVAGLQLRDLVSHAGALRELRRWLVGVCLGMMPLFALASAIEPATLAVGAAVWSIVVGLVLVRAWQQSRPWVWWLLPGMAALAIGGMALSAFTFSGTTGSAAAVAVGGVLTVWSACVFLATDWRARIFGETRARIDARNTVDPLTGLAMPMVLHERVHAARTMMQRYGHPSVLMMIHVENMARLSAEYGPEAAESAVLAAANRMRQSVRQGDVAARLTHSRMAVLAEGMAPPEAAANVASRILVAGLKEPLAQMPAEFLQFRIVLGAIPVDDIPPRLLLQRLGARLDQELHHPGERRIVTLSKEEFASQGAPHGALQGAS